MLVIGLIVPGFLLMVGFGALIATGHLSFWPTTLIAISGAITGDALSYWLGKHYQQQLQRMWPLSRYPTLIQQGQNFFKKHGKKSVALGRFFGPLRAIVPTIAGMSNMPNKQFYFSNVLSAIAWAPLYLLPGIIFGMSLQLAKEFAGQLALLIVVVVVLMLVLSHVVKSIYGWLAPQADVLSYRLLIWARNHPILGAIPDSLVNPQQSEIRAISGFGFLLSLSMFTLIILNHYLFNTLFLNNIDIFIHTQFVLLQHPLITKAALFISSFSHYSILFGVAALFSIWNFYNRNIKAVLFILAGLLLPWATIFLINIFSLSFSPFSQHYQETSHSSFILAMSLYGFMAIYFVKGLEKKSSLIVYTLTVLFLFATAFSLLYLGLQSFSTLLGHFLFGMVWVAILGIAYRRHPTISATTQKPSWITLTSIISLFLLTIIFYYNIQTPLEKISRQQTRFIIGYDAWLESGWKILPAFRNDIRGQQKQPLNIQWAANKKTLTELLKTNQWQQIENTTSLYFNWLRNISDPLKLPVVRHIHNGQYNTFTFRKKVSATRLAVIRLWATRYYTKNKTEKKPLWIGEIAFSEISYSPFVNYLTTLDNFNNTTDILKNDIRKAYEVRYYPINSEQIKNWNGEILLIK